MGKGIHAPAAGARVAAVAPARPDDLFDRCSAMGRPCQASTLCEDAGKRDGDETITYEGLDDSKGQAFMYPIPFKIRNTFVDCSAPSPSLRDFFQERKMQSAPPCRVLMPGSGVSEVDAELTASTPTSVMSETEPGVKAQHDASDDAYECKLSHRYWDVSEATPRSPDSTGQLFFSGDISLPDECVWEEQDGLACPDSTFFVVGSAQLPNLLASHRFAMPDVVHKTAPDSSASFAVVPPCSAGAAMDTACIPTATAQRTVLRLDDVLVEPPLGSPELPTVGSAGHAIGTCKPCAFMHTKGCGNGFDCQFCHLCEPGEKKRRRKEKVDMRRSMHRVQRPPAIFES